VVILIYIDQARKNTADLHEAIIQGALMRVRPIMMTVAAIIGGLLPIMWGSGTGSEVMRRIAAPMVGGMVSVTVLALVVIPAIYAVVKGAGIGRER
jgi:Cu(I)/Ag(I) efflux system membrane protein CusA/SilA